MSKIKRKKTAETLSDQQRRKNRIRQIAVVVFSLFMVVVLILPYFAR